MTKAIKALALVAALFGAPALAGTFVDGFDDTTLDTTTKWTVLANAGTIASGVGSDPEVLLLEGPAVCATCPAHKRINTIPMFKPGWGNEVYALGRAKLGGHYQKFGFNVNGLNNSWGAYFDTAEGAPNTVRAVVLDAAGNPVVNHGLNVSWGQYHTLKVTWALSWYWSWTGTAWVKVYTNKLSFFVDGVQRYTTQLPQSSYPVAYKPVGLWNDRPATMKVDYAFVTNRKVNLTLAQMGAIAGELNDNAGPGNGGNFCSALIAPAACNTGTVVKELQQEDGVIYSADLRTDQDSTQYVGLFILNEGPDLTLAGFSNSAWAPKNGYVNFDPYGTGGSLGPGQPLIGMLTVVKFSGVTMAYPSDLLNFHTRLAFWRGLEYEKLDIDVHFR